MPGHFASRKIAPVLARHRHTGQSDIDDGLCIGGAHLPGQGQLLAILVAGELPLKLARRALQRCTQGCPLILMISQQTRVGGHCIDRRTDSQRLTIAVENTAAMRRH